jgi:hypothetical protein
LRSPRLLSASRCIVLAESGTGHWRLWQILRLLPSLRDWMLEPHLDASELLTRMAESARVLADAHSRWLDSSLLPTFDTVGRGQRGAQFVGLMPESLQPRGGAQVDDAVSQCLAGLVHGDLSPRRDELTVAIGQLRPSWTWADDMIAAALTMSG